jgi:hypothetical protein
MAYRDAVGLGSRCPFGIQLSIVFGKLAIAAAIIMLAIMLKIALIPCGVSTEDTESTPPTGGVNTDRATPKTNPGASARPGRDIDPAALRFYHDRIVELQNAGIGINGSLTQLLQPLFADALTRSRDSDAAAENAALLTLLAPMSRGKSLRGLVPGDIERPKRFLLKLHRRRDFAQHFLVSAGLAARGDSELSNAVGLFKEIMDIDRGTGFSFSDLAADKAGSRFGELAVSDRATQLQQALAAGVDDADLLPIIDDLPEYMDDAEFEERFGRVGSPRYEAMMQDIRQRIMALPLYAEPESSAPGSPPPANR